MRFGGVASAAATSGDAASGIGGGGSGTFGAAGGGVAFWGGAPYPRGDSLAATSEAIQLLILLRTSSVKFSNRIPASFFDSLTQAICPLISVHSLDRGS